MEVNQMSEIQESCNIETNISQILSSKQDGESFPERVSKNHLSTCNDICVRRSYLAIMFNVHFLVLQ